MTPKQEKFAQLYVRLFRLILYYQRNILVWHY